MTTVKIVRTGDTQLIELPEGYRFDSEEVTIRRDGDSVVLQQRSVSIPDGDWSWLDEVIGAFEQDFLDATEEDEGPFEDRPERDNLFR